MLLTRKLTRCAHALLLSLFLFGQGKSDVNLYTVGNSLSNQLSQFDGLSWLANNGGTQLNVGYHIYCARSLTTILANPQTTCIEPRFGYFGDAFANKQLDVVTLQPFYGATLREEINSAKQFVSQLRSNPINQNTRVLIYGTWATDNETTRFLDSWNDQNVTLDSPFAPSKRAYELFMNELLVTVPDAGFIPAGHLYYEIARRGGTPEQIPGLTTVRDLLSDGLHSTFNGYFVHDLAAYSAIYDKSPIGLEYLSFFGSSTVDKPLRPDAVAMVEDLTWDIVQASKGWYRAGSSEGEVSLSFGNNLSSVPEVSSAMLVAFSFVSTLAMRRKRR